MDEMGPVSAATSRIKLFHWTGGTRFPSRQTARLWEAEGRQTLSLHHWVDGQCFPEVEHLMWWCRPHYYHHLCCLYTCMYCSIFFFFFNILLYSKLNYLYICSVCAAQRGLQTSHRCVIQCCTRTNTFAWSLQPTGSQLTKTPGLTKHS